MIDFTVFPFHKDDFSTGQNDMDALMYFKPHFAKLDRSLIANVNTDTEKQNKVSELIKIFHEMGIKVIAEGIETHEELEYLTGYSEVDYLQGYYLGMPK